MSEKIDSNEIAAEREACIAACMRVNEDADFAADKGDVASYDKESYLAGYRDATLDWMEEIRARADLST